MKIQKEVTFSKIIEMDVHIEDMVEGFDDFKDELNFVYRYLHAVTPKMISELSKNERKSVFDFLKEQSKRYIEAPDRARCLTAPAPPQNRT